MKIIISFLLLFGIPDALNHIDETIKLAVEPNHSTIQFAIPISGGLTRVTGKFTDFSIDMDYVDGDMTRSSIHAIIKAASINTGIPDRDDHLRTEDFFEVENYPEITFKTDSIVRNGEEYTAHGQFQMHGISKALALPLKMNGIDGKYTIGISSKLSIKRSDYDIGTEFQHTSMPDFLGDEIAVEIDFWTKKRKEKSP